MKHLRAALAADRRADDGAAGCGGRMAVAAGAHGQHLRRRRHRRRADAARRRPALGHVQAAVLVETRAGAGRHDRGEVGRRLAARRLQLRAHQHHRIWCWRRSAIRSSATIRKRDLTNIGYDRGLAVSCCRSTPTSSIKTLKDSSSRAADRAKPLTYSSSGVGSSGHLVAENFAKLAGIKIEHVPYKGASQGLTDLAGGHIVFSAQTVSSTAALVRGGTLRALAHTGTTRLPDFPDVPTLQGSWATTSSPPLGSRSPGRPTCRRTSPRRSTREINRAVQRRRRKRGCGAMA